MLYETIRTQMKTLCFNGMLQYFDESVKDEQQRWVRYPKTDGLCRFPVPQ